MMKRIRATEAETYEHMWDVPNYAVHSPGMSVLPLFLDMVNPAEYSTVLDAGCGSGAGSVALLTASLDVSQCDLVDARTEDAKRFPFQRHCLWDVQLSRYDYVYCCDVMEHVPVEFTMLVASRLYDAVNIGAFFHVSLVPDAFGVYVGKPLHQSVFPFTWWRDRFSEICEIVESRDLITSGAFFLRRV